MHGPRADVRVHALGGDKRLINCADQDLATSKAVLSEDLVHVILQYNRGDIRDSPTTIHHTTHPSTINNNNFTFS